MPILEASANGVYKVVVLQYSSSARAGADRGLKIVVAPETQPSVCLQHMKSPLKLIQEGAYKHDTWGNSVRFLALLKLAPDSGFTSGDVFSLGCVLLPPQLCVTDRGKLA